jgi:hypothetical protein
MMTLNKYLVLRHARPLKGHLVLDELGIAKAMP